ncbi:hypothetical protein Tco_0400134, partial [Tanacetum coccineum]
KEARSRQKSYADKHRRDLEFQVGDRVFLKVSPFRGVKRFGIKGKLSPRFIGPFEILERIGEVSYRLALPSQLSHVHDIQPDMSLSEEPESILDRYAKIGAGVAFGYVVLSVDFLEIDSLARLMRWFPFSTSIRCYHPRQNGQQRIGPADLFPRLENPHQIKLGEQGITEIIPLETLGIRKISQGMRCLKMSIQVCESLTFGHRTSWDPSHLLKGTNTYLWRDLVPPVPSSVIVEHIFAHDQFAKRMSRMFEAFVLAVFGPVDHKRLQQSLCYLEYRYHNLIATNVYL